MDVWTIQKKEIIDMVKNGDTWYPDKNKGGVNGLEFCYEAATEIINDLNHTSYKGTVFTMARSDGSSFASAEELKEEFANNKTLLGFISKDGEDLRCEGNRGCQEFCVNGILNHSLTLSPKTMENWLMASPQLRIG